MAQTMTITQDTLKKAMKEALVETLREQRSFLREILAETLEEIALVEAIEEGRQSEYVSRERVFDLLNADVS